MSSIVNLTAQHHDFDSRIRQLLIDVASDQTAADQLATDASRLASLSKDRIKDFQGAGFFRRFWYKFTGETTAIQRATTSDLVAMQNMAWQYLAALQKQNLFSARAITVVRNNLSQVAGSHERLGTLILTQAKKVGKLAQDVRVIDWRDGLKVREDYASLPELLRVLKASFEYAEKFDEHEHVIDRLDTSHDLEIAFSNLCIAPGRKLTLGDFAQALSLEVMEKGVEIFTRITEIRIGDQLLDPGQVSGLVAGRAFECIYDLAKEIPLAMRIAQTENTDIGSSLIQKAARAVVSEPDAEYDLIVFSKELIAGAALVRDLLRPAIESISTATEQPTRRRISVMELIAQHIPLRSHALSGLDLPRTVLQRYIDALMLVAVEEELSPTQRSFLVSLGKVLQVDGSEQRAKNIMADTADVGLEEILKLLSGHERQFAWLVDAIFLGSTDKQLSDNARSRILQMTRVFDLKNDVVEVFIRCAEVLATSSQPEKIANAVVLLYRDTAEWKTIIDFRKVSLTGAFSELVKKYQDTFKVEMRLCLEVAKLMREVNSTWISFGDENIFIGTALSIGRKMTLSNYENLIKEIQAFAIGVKKLVSEANSYIRAFGFKGVEIESDDSSINFEADINISSKNDSWNDSMGLAVDQLNTYFDAHSKALSISWDNLSKIEAGKWS